MKITAQYCGIFHNKGVPQILRLHKEDRFLYLGNTRKTKQILFNLNFDSYIYQTKNKKKIRKEKEAKEQERRGEEKKKIREEKK